MQPWHLLCVGQGCKEMVAEAAGSPERVLPSLPKIVPMLRTALVTKHPGIVLTGLQFLRQLATSSPEVRRGQRCLYIQASTPRQS